MHACAVLQVRREVANSADSQQNNLKATQLQQQFPNLAQKLSETQCGTSIDTDNNPVDSSMALASTSTTATGIINKYIADIQTNVTMGDKPLEFWLYSCPKAYSQLSVLGVDLLAAPASQAFVERLFSVCGMLSQGRRNRMENPRNESLVKSEFQCSV